jgi:hypothetical protein
MNNIIQFNPYVNLTFQELMQKSNENLSNFNPEIAIKLMNEFTRRLSLENKNLSDILQELRGNL